MIGILQAEKPEQIEEARTLFREYERWLGLDICFQNFEEELQNLPGKYAAPDGRLFLAAVDEKIAGCIALRKIEENICEMKRLFVRKEFRGHGLGDKLIKKLISQAQEIGYERTWLAHCRKMRKAVSFTSLTAFGKSLLTTKTHTRKRFLWKNF